MQQRKQYDLEERLTNFAVSCIQVAEKSSEQFCRKSSSWSINKEWLYITEKLKLLNLPEILCIK